MTELEVGAEYIIEDRRKGTFQAELLGDNGLFLLVRITKGKAHFASVAHNLLGKGNVGDIISVKKKFCNFSKVKKK